MSTTDELQKLADLHDRGVLSDADFQAAKDWLLDSTHDAPNDGGAAAARPSDPAGTPGPADRPSPPQPPFVTQRTPTNTGAPPPPPTGYGWQPPYGTTPGPARPTPTRTNGPAIVAFVAAFLFWPLGIVFGHVARHQIRRTGERGAGLSLAALIISYVWGAIAIILIIVVVAVAVSSNAGGFNNLGTLENSVTQQANANLQNPSSTAYSPGTSVDSTLCVHNSGTQYSCIVTLSNGNSSSISVTVSSDGSRWVSNG